jgi:hypothetical protein
MTAMKTNFVIILLAVMTLFYNENAYCQKHNECILDIDSLFQSHFLSLDTTIKCDANNRFIISSDKEFIYMISFLSGIPFKMHSYSGHPELNNDKLTEYKYWYHNYRTKVKCETVLHAYILLRKETLSEEIIEELEKLQIE